ncbi:MAG: DNA-directed RNA polymerase subunit beta, partial [Microbacterium sp.]
EATEPERGTAFTTRALRLSTYAGDLAACAALWRMQALT